MDRKFSIYIMNRLQEIRENSTVEEWNFIPGEINPADNCTRYTSFSKLAVKKNW